ncbi:MAG: carbohydrate-binding domain-containing protein, partial [Prevotella sp.]|nr:carbohydrate-binding domain-containing protein [Prevotella sp.]
MKKGLLLAIPLIMGCACYGEDVTISYQGATAIVTQNTKDSVSVTVDGARVSIESLYQGRKLTLRLTGESDDGRLTLKTAGKAIVTLDGLKLTSQEGAPIELKNKKKVEVTTEKGTENTLTITACTDTANHKAAVIWAKDKLLLSGKGLLNVVATGDGCRGIKTKKDITIQDVTLNVTTSGNNLGVKPNQFPGGFPGGEMPAPGKFPGFPGDSIKSGGFPSFPGDSTMQGGFPGKQKYVASTKGIASKGKITINGGTVTVRTSTPGAE